MKMVADKIKELYSIVNELEESFPGRHFTPDGHLVGSIGEVLAAHYYGLELFSASTATHDARSASGKLVQIKATQGDSVGLRSEPEHLLVLKILKNGEVVEIFNGPGYIAWEAAGKMQRNGQRTLSVNKLIKLMSSITNEYKV
jgi:hypothetical protein